MKHSKDLPLPQPGKKEDSSEIGAALADPKLKRTDMRTTAVL
jgi:hypothetical protein